MIITFILISASYFLTAGARRCDIASIEGTARTKEEAQAEIDTIKALVLALCNENKELVAGKVPYLTRLSCALAKRQFNCLCIPKQEHIPIINEENVLKFNNYSAIDQLGDELKEVNDKVASKIRGPSLQEKFAGN